MHDFTTFARTTVIHRHYSLSFDVICHHSLSIVCGGKPSHATESHLVIPFIHSILKPPLHKATAATLRKVSEDYLPSFWSFPPLTSVLFFRVSFDELLPCTMWLCRHRLIYSIPLDLPFTAWCHLSGNLSASPFFCHYVHRSQSHCCLTFLLDRTALLLKQTMLAVTSVWHPSLSKPVQESCPTFP